MTSCPGADPGKPGEKLIPQCHRFSRRHGFIIYVACDHHGVRMNILCIADHLPQDMGLVFPQIIMVQLLADMQV